MVRGAARRVRPYNERRRIPQINNKMIVAVAVTAGMLGGVLSRYITPPTAFAQDQTPVTKEIRAESFTLVDSTDYAVGTFRAEPLPGSITVQVDPGIPLNGQSVRRFERQEMRIVLRDSNGREMWSAGSGVRMLPALVGSAK